MRTAEFLVALIFVEAAHSQSSFDPPAASVIAVEGVNFRGNLIGNKIRSRFTECDTKNTCDGLPLKYGCRNDPNRNSTILQLKDGTIFYDGKMGLDADGSPYSQKTPGKTDQAQTSLRYSLPGKPSINADSVPYVVIPLGGFDKSLGVQVGDVAAVVYGPKRVFAVVADKGPKCKLGEGSIQLHELLGHTVCKMRAPNGDCVKLRDEGIENDVLYFLFPGTHKDLLPGLTPENILQRLETIGSSAWKNLSTP